MKAVIRKIISRKQWDNLIEKGMLKSVNTGFGKNYELTLREYAMNKLTPETLGEIEERDYQLTTIICSPDMYKIYIKEESYDIAVDYYENPYEHKHRYYIPEWMFEDRQDDLVDLYKRYGKHKEE